LDGLIKRPALIQKDKSYKPPEESDLGRSGTAFLFCLLIMAAIWTRFSGLGERQLAQDEYYFIKSIQNILRFGVPQFPDGGYYVRGILLQYLTTAWVFLFGESNFAYRFFPALFGVGTVAMAYFLGRQFLSRSWSIILAAMVTFSSWEIEFSRLARMYSGFQFFAVCFFWALYRYSFKERSNKRYLAHAFAFITIGSHELGVFVAVFLFLPLFARLNGSWRRGMGEESRYITIALAVLIVGLFLATYPFRFKGVVDPLPLDFMAQSDGIQEGGLFGSRIFGKTPFWGAGILLASIIAGWYAIEIYRKRLTVGLEEQILGGLVLVSLWFAIFHQFAACTLIIMIVALRNPKILLRKPYIYLFTLIILLGISWLALLLYNRGGENVDGFVNIARAYRKAIRQNFFSFPNIYLPVINAWVTKTPLLSLLLGAAIAHQLVRIRKFPLGSIVMNPVMPLLIIIVMIGILPPRWSETRYTHFIYPLVLCGGVLSAFQLGEFMRRRFSGNGSASMPWIMFFCLSSFAATEDFNFFHLINLNADSIAFRTEKYAKFETHWYPRWDFENPAELINSNSSANSRIIVSCDADTIGYYLKGDFAIYFPMDAPDYSIISRDRGRRELWSGKRMLSNIEGIKDFTRDTESVWLVTYPKWGSLRVEPEEIWPGRVRKVEIYKPGRDKRIEVKKIEIGL